MNKLDKTVGSLPAPDGFYLQTMNNKENINNSEAENKQEESDSVAITIVKKVESEGFTLFHDQYKDGFVSLTGDGKGTYKLHSKSFKQWLSYYVTKNVGKIPGTETVTSVTRALEGKAIFERQQYPLEVRIARYKEGIWYDLGNANAVLINKNGWQLVDLSPIIFRSLPHQKVQVKPENGGSVSKILDFVNLKTEEDKLLFQVYLVTAFIPNFPHPLLVFFGPQGAAKTTTQRLLKSLIDPSVMKTFSFPDSEREFAQLAYHHYFLFFDNVSSLPLWQSNALAKAITGDGFSKRQLYSDDDDVIFVFQRAMAINGINLVVQRPDLLERSLLICLDRISKKARREEEEFWKVFEEVKPKILGAIFETIVIALSVLPDIILTELPRMADFARYGSAVAEALGYTKEQFLTAYQNNLKKQNDEALDASPVATAIIAFVDKQESTAWEGEPSELHKELTKVAVELQIDLKSRDWPKSPTSLWKYIQRVHTNLAEADIHVVRNAKARPRKIRIEKATDSPDVTDELTRHEENKQEIKLDGLTEKFGMDTLSDSRTHEKAKHSLSLPTVATGISLQSCYSCGGNDFWRTTFNSTLCVACHPPASEADIVERIEVQDEA